MLEVRGSGLCVCLRLRSALASTHTKRTVAARPHRRAVFFSDPFLPMPSVWKDKYLHPSGVLASFAPIFLLSSLFVLLRKDNSLTSYLASRLRWLELQTKDVSDTVPRALVRVMWLGLVSAKLFHTSLYFVDFSVKVLKVYRWKNVEKV